jgi:tetratricopeptide (TPR) repeat protein
MKRIKKVKNKLWRIKMLFPLKKILIPGLALIFLLAQPLQSLTQEVLTVDSLAVDTINGNVIGNMSNQSGLINLFALEKAILINLLEKLNIPLSTLPPEVQKMLKINPTTKIKAFISFAKGLDHYDKGEYDKAKDFFEHAVKVDPGFEEAQIYYDSTPDDNMSVSDVINKAMEFTRKINSVEEWDKQTFSRLVTEESGLNSDLSSHPDFWFNQKTYEILTQEENKTQVIHQQNQSKTLLNVSW